MVVASHCATQGVVVGDASRPEHEYEKLNYDLMAENNKKTLTDLKLNSLGRCCTLYIQRGGIKAFDMVSCGEKLSAGLASLRAQRALMTMAI